MNQFWYFLGSIRWQDVVDIILNSYILFRFYVLFRGTNAFRVLIGIALLWFFQRAAVSMGLIVTSWAIQGITAVAAIIIIVVFRNEIRSVLQAKNIKTVLWGFGQKAVNTPVEIIVDSAFTLANRRIGALIVLPGREDLKDIVHSGMAWRGLVSKEMIMSVFWPDNPVHDGAAIINGNQITRVSTILPLSQREDLKSYYGTRHRAALGLAETSDALTIVVSEERGNIMVAKSGLLREVFRHEDLKEMLEEHLGQAVKLAGQPRREKIEIGTAALVSTLFIIGVWFSFSRGGLESLVTLQVPIEYMNRNSGMEILDASDHTVNVQMSGSGALIKSVRPDQVKVRLDLSKAVVGPNTFGITKESISLPPGIILRRVTPAAVDVTLDVPIKKRLPIQVDWVGKLPGDLVLQEAVLSPTHVQVVGGSQLMDQLATVYTRKVTLERLNESGGTLTVGLAISPAGLSLAAGEKDRITVVYRISKRTYPG